MSSGSRTLLEGYFREAVAAASPARCLPRFLPAGRPAGRTLVLGCGKAAAEMAAIAWQHAEGEVVGCVVTRHGHGTPLPTGPIAVIEASHPVPDTASLYAGRAIRTLATGARRR